MGYHRYTYILVGSWRRYINIILVIAEVTVMVVVIVVTVVILVVIVGVNWCHLVFLATQTMKQGVNTVQHHPALQFYPLMTF